MQSLIGTRQNLALIRNWGDSFSIKITNIWIWLWPWSKILKRFFCWQMTSYFMHDIQLILFSFLLPSKVLLKPNPLLKTDWQSYQNPIYIFLEELRAGNNLLCFFTQWKYQVEKIGLSIQIQNPILILDCQSQSNPPNWIAIQIEISNPAIPWWYLIKYLRIKEKQISFIYFKYCKICRITCHLNCRFDI